MHETHAALLQLHTVADGSQSSPDVRVALITGAALVLAAIVTGLIGTIKREPTPRSTVESNDALTVEMVHEVQEALDTCNEDLAGVRRSYAALRDACWRLHMDPDEMIRGAI